MGYHPSKHVTPNRQSSKSNNHHRPRTRAFSSSKVTQYFDLSTDERKYLTKLKAALQKVNWKLCHNITKLIIGLPQKGLENLPPLIIGDPILDKKDSVFYLGFLAGEFI